MNHYDNAVIIEAVVEIGFVALITVFVITFVIVVISKLYVDVVYPALWSMRHPNGLDDTNEENKDDLSE